MARLGRALPIKPHFKRPPFFPPFFLKISGIVTNSGSPQAGALVYLLDETTDLLVGLKTTNGSGYYEFNSSDGLVSTHTYHAAVEYESGPTKYNAKSLPFLSPVQN